MTAIVKIFSRLRRSMIDQSQTLYTPIYGNIMKTAEVQIFSRLRRDQSQSLLMVICIMKTAEA